MKVIVDAADHPRRGIARDEIQRDRPGALLDMM
jgi:hypothetical protein